MQARGRVHSVDPEVIDGIGGVVYLCRAIHHKGACLASLTGKCKVHTSASQAVDRAQRSHFRQVHGAVNGDLPLRPGKVGEGTGGLQLGFSGGEVQRLQIDRVAGCFQRSNPVCCGERLTLLGGDIGAGYFAQIVIGSRRIGDHHAQIVGGKLKGHGALIEQRHAVMNLDPVRLQIEDGSGRDVPLLPFALGVGWLVCRRGK